MLFSLNLLETFPLNIVNIFFFFIFFVVLLLSYPIGRYFLSNYCENSLIKNSIFSITIFAVLISIIVNLAPIFSKYIIVIFYLTNLFVLTISTKIRNDLFDAIISSKFILLVTFLIFLILNITYQPIVIENGELNFKFNTHFVYFINPVTEILTSDYFSRIKILSLYPLEWSAFHFFQASFNSIFLSTIYLSGTIGLITLKNFYISIFVSLFCFSFFKDESFTKKEYPLIILKVLLIILLFIFLFNRNVSFLITTNYFVSVLSTIFIIQSLFSKNKNDLLIWTIILAISSFGNIFICLMLAVYYLIESQNFNFKIFVHKIKKSLNLPNLLLLILFLFEMLSAFYQAEFTQPRYNLPSNKSWWLFTITYPIIESYKLFFLTLILLTIIYLSLLKFFFNKQLNFALLFNRHDFFYFNIVLIIPFIFLILLIFKNQILDIYNIEKLKIFFDSLNITNLSFYFFVPLIWCFILLCSKILVRYIFIIIIVIYTFLSMFIYSPIVLPAFFTLEILILFYVSHILLNFKVENKKKTFCYLFMVSVITFSMLQLNFLQGFISYKTKTKFVFEIKELKELKKRKHICPQDIKRVGSHKYTGEALSAILAKPYYSDIPIIDVYSHWENISLRFAVPPKQQVNNPCKNE